MENLTKKCSNGEMCVNLLGVNAELLLCEFSPEKNGKYGVDSKCKACRRKYANDKYRNDLEYADRQRRYKREKYANDFEYAKKEREDDRNKYRDDKVWSDKIKKSKRDRYQNDLNWAKKERGRVNKKNRLDRYLCIQHYGLKCQCPGCNEDRYECLTIDHINGYDKNSGEPRAGNPLYRWIIKNNFPEGFQTLCSNCNQTKSASGCPHLINTNPKDKWNRGIKIKCLNAYGGCKCVHCGECKIEFLTLDHVFGGGKKDKRENKISNIYSYLRKLNYPNKDRYQVLCFNCNEIKRKLEILKIDD